VASIDDVAVLPTAIQNDVTGQSADRSWLVLPDRLGVGNTDQLAPSQLSTKAFVAAPTAMQDDGATHETPSNGPSSLDSSIDHVVPSQV